MKREFLLVLIIIAVFSCKKTDPDPEKDLPTKAILVFPYQNSLCNHGTNTTATESTLLFEWEAGLYTDSYELKVEDLTDGSVTSYPTTATQVSVTLDRGVPYAWFVISISSKVEETVQSDIWKFYIEGEAVQYYAPFPAEILSPAMASTITASSGVVSLDWNGHDVDGDIVAYDLYFGTDSPPTLYQGDITETILNNVSVTVGNIYYWEVITRDAAGNISNSGIYQFKVE